MKKRLNDALLNGELKVEKIVEITNIRFVSGAPFSFGEGMGKRQPNSITAVQVSDTTMLNSSTTAGPQKSYEL